MVDQIHHFQRMCSIVLWLSFQQICAINCGSRCVNIGYDTDTDTRKKKTKTPHDKENSMNTALIHEYVKIVWIKENCQNLYNTLNMI